MAGAGRRIFQPGEILTASNTMNYLMDQAVQVYAGTAARGSAIGSAVSEGMISYLADSNAVEVYNGSAWNQVSQAISPNYVINGGFDIWQRGTSFSVNPAYTADRWQIAFGGTGTAQTASQQAFTAGSAPVSGYEGTYFLRNVVTGGSGTGSVVVVQQPIEDVRTLAGQTATVSFWAKASTGTPNLGYDLYQSFGSGGSATVGGIGAGKVTLSTSWTRYSFTVAVPSIAGKTIGTNHALVLRLWFSSGSDYNSLNGSIGIQSNTFDVWGVQLEAGSTATPFRRNANSIQGELSACQRYFRRYTSINGDEIMWNGTWYETTALWVPMVFPVPMRAKPVVSYSGTINCYGGGGSSLTTSIDEYVGGVPTGNGGVYTFKNSGGNTTGRSGFVGLANAGNYIQFNAEL